MMYVDISSLKEKLSGHFGLAVLMFYLIHLKIDFLYFKTFLACLRCHYGL